MSVVVAFKLKNQLIMVGDDRITDNLKIVPGCEKVIKVGDFLVGGVGEVKSINRVFEALQEMKESNITFDCIKETINEKTDPIARKKKHQDEKDRHTAFMIGTPSGIWWSEPDLHSKLVTDFFCIGAGDDFVNGYISAIKRTRSLTKKDIHNAIVECSKYNNSIGMPGKFYSIDLEIEE